MALDAHRNPGPDMEPTAWIAARYEAASLPDQLLLGDGTWPGSGDHFNRPLPSFLPYRVFLRAVTVTNVSPPLSLYSSLPAAATAVSFLAFHFVLC